MWFRLYTDILHDAKVQLLAPEQFKGWVNLLCLAKENDGLLPSLRDIAFNLRMLEADAKRLVEELAEQGLLDQTEDGLQPHNWDERQFLSDSDPTAAIRSRRYRQRNVTRDATSNDADASRPPEAETDSETEQIQRQNQKEASRGKPRSVSRRPVCDEEYFEELQQNPAYKSLDVRRVFHKMVAWCNVKGKQPTRARLVNWLSREDAPMDSPPKTGNAYVGKRQPAAAPDSNDFMSNTVDNLIAEEDFLLAGQIYDEIIERGGAKAEWEIRLVAWYELHKDQPATPEQVATLKASIDALANKH